MCDVPDRAPDTGEPFRLLTGKTCITDLAPGYVPGIWVTLFDVDDAAALSVDLGAIMLDANVLPPALYAGELQLLPVTRELQDRIVLVPEPATPTVLVLASGLFMLVRRRSGPMKVVRGCDPDPPSASRPLLR